jgi:methionine-rich copper-binding protein CopC
VLRATVRFDRPLEDPVLAAAFVNPQHQNVFVPTSAAQPDATGSFKAGERAELRISFENALAPGRYAVSTLLTQASGHIEDRWEGIFTFVVTGAQSGGGLVDLPHDVQLEPLGQAPEGKLRA